MDRIHQVGSTSSSLLLRLRSQDNVAWEQFVDVYGWWIYRKLRRLGARDVVAEDLMQEVLLSVCTKVGGFERLHRYAFRGWLKQITLNKFRDWRRRSQDPKGGSEAQQQINQVSDPLTDSTEELDSQDSVDLVHRALLTIKPSFDQKSVVAFQKYVIEGYPAQVVADELGISLNALYVIKSKIIKKLRELVSDWFEC